MAELAEDIATMEDMLDKASVLEPCPALLELIAVDESAVCGDEDAATLRMMTVTRPDSPLLEVRRSGIAKSP